MMALATRRGTLGSHHSTWQARCTLEWMGVMVSCSRILPKGVGNFICTMPGPTCVMRVCTVVKPSLRPKMEICVSMAI